MIAGEANAAGHKAVTVVVDAVKGSRLSPGQIAARIALGARLRNYRFDKYKTKDKPEQKLSLEQLTVIVAGPAEARRAYAALEPVVDVGVPARDLVSDRPTSPTRSSSRAAPASSYQARRQGRGPGRGRDEEARHERAARRRPGRERESQLLVMRWMNGPKNQAPVALVGKGVASTPAASR